MNNKAFIYGIVKLYRKARKSKFPDKIIKRGRSHSISSSAEDLFALFLVRKIYPDVIFIDQPISVNGFKIQNYPDIVVTYKKTITAFCDLKMDIGRKRSDLYNICNHHYRWLKKIRGRQCKIRDGITKKDSFYKISPRATYSVILISDKNINKDVLKKHIGKIRKLSPIVELFVLTSREHPNTYGISIDDLIKKIEIRDYEFLKLVDKLKAGKFLNSRRR